MGLKTRFYAYYYTGEGKITGLLRDAQAFVAALKGDELKCHYADIPAPTGGYYRIKPGNTKGAKIVLRDWAKEKFKRLKKDGCYLVAVPPSSATTDATEPTRTDKLAATIAAGAGDHVVAIPLLRWNQKMRRARDGGPREAHLLYPHLRAIAKVKKGANYVIFDDVCTSGGHLQAAAAFIRVKGGNVIGALCAARTSQEPVKKPFGGFKDKFQDWDPDD